MGHPVVLYYSDGIELRVKYALELFNILTVGLHFTLSIYTFFPMFLLNESIRENITFLLKVLFIKVTEETDYLLQTPIFKSLKPDI